MLMSIWLSARVYSARLALPASVARLSVAWCVRGTLHLRLGNFAGLGVLFFFLFFCFSGALLY